MKRYMIAAGLMVLVSCIALAAFRSQSDRSDEQTFTNNGYTWKRLTGNAAFPKSYNFQLFTRRDTLWAFHPAGTWYSTDGNTWKKTPLSNPIVNHAFLDYVYFNNTVIGLGGFEGNIERFTLSSAINSTSDFKNWKLLAGKSNLPARFFYHPFVFNNRIWIVGGTDGEREYSDIWSSADGIQWTKEAEHLAFGPRSNSQFVILNNTIYMLNNDVWASTDAIHWTKLTDEIVKGQQLFGYATAVYDNRIWLFGCNRNGQFTSKSYSSEDGKTWIPNDAPWSPRGGMAACIFKGKVFVTGGKYGGQNGNDTEFIYSNDVWSLEKASK